jgi:hypothetical protein
MRMKAYANVNGFTTAFLKDPVLPEKEEEEIDETSNEGKVAAAATSHNAMAMACFTMAFVTEGMMMLLYQAMIPEWPNGLAYRVIESLASKFHPIDMMSKVEVRAELNSIAMKKKVKPSDLFEKISSVKNWYNCGVNTISEDELMAVVIGAAPIEYQSSLLNEQRNKGNSGMVDLQEGDRNAGIMMPNGNIMKPSKTGKLPVVVCNKHAEELFNAVVEDVNIVPEQQFNLFSTTKLIKAGWIPGGNTEVLWFTKNGTVLKLDIEIPTKNGCIFGIYLK